MKKAQLEMIKKIAPKPGRIYEQALGVSGSAWGWTVVRIGWSGDTTWRPDFLQGQDGWIDASDADYLCPLVGCLEPLGDAIWGADARRNTSDWARSCVLWHADEARAGIRDTYARMKTPRRLDAGRVVWIPEVILRLLDAARKGVAVDARLACSDGAVVYKDAAHLVVVGIDWMKTARADELFRMHKAYTDELDEKVDEGEFPWDALELEEADSARMWHPHKRMEKWISSYRYDALDEDRRASDWMDVVVPDKIARLAKMLSEDEGGRLRRCRGAVWRWELGEEGSVVLYHRCKG